MTKDKLWSILTPNQKTAIQKQQCPILVSQIYPYSVYRRIKKGRWQHLIEGDNGCEWEWISCNDDKHFLDLVFYGLMEGVSE